MGKKNCTKTEIGWLKVGKGLRLGGAGRHGSSRGQTEVNHVMYLYPLPMMGVIIMNCQQVQIKNQIPVSNSYIQNDALTQPHFMEWPCVISLEVNWSQHTGVYCPIAVLCF